MLRAKHWLILRPAKRQRSDFCGSANAEMNGQRVSGLWVAPKMFIIISHTELGKPQEYYILGAEEAVKRESSVIITEIRV